MVQLLSFVSAAGLAGLTPISFTDGLGPVGLAAVVQAGGKTRRPYDKMEIWLPMHHLLRFMPAVPNLGLTGIVDILVVSFLVYEALMVVRGTRAGHILIGISVMVLLYAVALWAGLEALRSILSFIVPYIGLAIIVLFQSEIRRTLARIGRKRWLGAGFHAPESANEILLAVEDLAQKSTGALIVLERDIGLRTFIESGVPLEALLSRDLLLSIFQPGLPLHDGAVIVQKGRIAAAACFLPLTTNPALSRTFGTRHRAAIGITEETDCLSIVISEESGLISVASFGELNQGLSVAEVEKRINLHFDVGQPALTHTDEFVASLLPAQETGTETGDARPVEKAAQP